MKSKNLSLVIYSFILLYAGKISAAGIIPCGTSINPGSCTLCHLFVLIQNIINFLLIPCDLNKNMPIVTMIALAMIVAGGFTFIISGNNPGRQNKAKAIITAVVIGLVVIFAGWVIVNTIFSTLGLQKWQGFNNWWQIKCE